MENFNWEQFTKRIFVNADLKKVYNAWTKSEELEQWFLSKATFYLESGEALTPSTNVSSNCRYQWNWFAQNYYEEGTIIRLNDRDSIEFTFAGNCTVQVKLSEQNDQTLIELTQSEIPLDDNSKRNIRLGCAFGWTFYLINLKSVLEGGLDLRNKNSDLVDLVNN